MSENEKMAESTQLEENNATTAEKVETPKAERTFTQADIDRIVSERLARQKEQMTKHQQIDEREAALKVREDAITAKETYMQCEQYLKDINLHEKHRDEFLKALDTSNYERFKNAVDILGKPYIVHTEILGATTYNPPRGDFETQADLSAAFRPNKK